MNYSIRKGVTVVEMVTMISIAFVVLGVSLPLLQSSREASRKDVCQDNLRILAVAATEYDSINGMLPPYIGLRPEQSRNVFDGFDYILDHQNTFPITQLLSLLGYPDLVVSVDPLAFDFELEIVDGGYPDFASWFNGVSGTRPGIEPIVFFDSQIPEALCPSDKNAQKNGILIASFVTDNASVSTRPVPQNGNAYSVTNYVANAGGFGVTTYPKNPDLIGFWGPIRSREADAIMDISDGASNVVLFGESVGQIGFNDPEYRYSMVLGGLCIGNTEAYAVGSVFGDIVESSFIQFGSAHPDVVNVVFADGTTRSISRNIQSVIFGRMCGVSDGQPVWNFNKN